MKPVVALVGRPNVGKSALFNRIVQKRVSIVEDIPGVTRDRVYADAEWAGKDFVLIDTGGFEVAGKDMSQQIRAQAEAAINEADVVVLVVDGRDGPTSDDFDVAQIIRSGKRPVVLAVNKVDNPERSASIIAEFYELGLGEPMPVSSIHGMGVGDLLDATNNALPEEHEAAPIMTGGEPSDETLVRVAIVGRPNVGKSSLVNALTQQDRMIVSDIPGTTRDAVDVRWDAGDSSYVLIDTAGLRRKSKIGEQLEKYSANRSLKAIDRCDVALIMLDASEGVLEQDKKVAGYAVRQGKACIILVNKWDMVDPDENDQTWYAAMVKSRINFLSFAPVVFISARTGMNLDRIPDAIDRAYQAYTINVRTADLNRVIQDAVRVSPPPSRNGKQLKVFYGTQVNTKAPAFLFFVNQSELITDPYQRYVEDRLRGVFPLEGTPVRLVWRSRE